MLRTVIAILAVFGLLAWSISASAQDLAVTGERVNLRSEPSTAADVVSVLTRGQALLELERQGEWVRVRSAGDPPDEGWVHGSLVGAPGGDDAVAAVPAVPASGDFATFELAIDQLNAVAKAQGDVYFTGGRDAGAGVAEVTAGPTWLATPESFRRSNLETLYSLWRSMNDPAAPVSVRILDEKGETVMEQTGP
jgi:uncharacterized protein YraI